MNAARAIQDALNHQKHLDFWRMVVPYRINQIIEAGGRIIAAVKERIGD